MRESLFGSTTTNRTTSENDGALSISHERPVTAMEQNTCEGQESNLQARRRQILSLTGGSENLTPAAESEVTPAGGRRVSPSIAAVDTTSDATFEPVEPAPVVASVAWTCDTCSAYGVLNLGQGVDVLGLTARIKQMHREKSPSCPTAAEGMTPRFEQIEIPEGAAVNDPRVRSQNPRLDAAIDEPRPSSRPISHRTSLLAVSALAAMSMMPAAAQRHLERSVDRLDPQPSPKDAEAFRSRRTEADDRRAQQRLAQAQAKRQRRAQKRRGAR